MGQDPSLSLADVGIVPSSGVPIDGILVEQPPSGQRVLAGGVRAPSLSRRTRCRVRYNRRVLDWYVRLLFIRG
jgi:hypothetical protein